MHANGFNALLDIDDRFVAISMLCELRQLDPSLGDSAFLVEQRRQVHEAYLRHRLELSAALGSFCDEVVGARSLLTGASTSPIEK